MVRRRLNTSVVLEGEPVRLVVDRLTVSELDRVAEAVIPRGSGVEARVVLELTRAQTAHLDTHVQVVKGDLLVEAVEVVRLGDVFGAQTDTIHELFHVLLGAQSLSTSERTDLTVGTRFHLWLSDEDRKPSKWKETGSSCQKCHELQLCRVRACGGVPAKKVVWHDRRIHVHECPIRSLTPEVERVIRLFEWTHAWGAHGFEARHLPGAQSVNDQEAWTLAAVTFVRGIYADVYADAIRKARDDGS